VFDPGSGEATLYGVAAATDDERLRLHLVMQGIRRSLVGPAGLVDWAQLCGPTLRVDPPSLLTAPSALLAGRALLRAITRPPTVAGLLGQVATPRASTSRRSL
jgi:hypothetical protein